jgi:preprotein translocase subunit SecE
MFKKLYQYLGEVKIELQKATWPWDPKETGFKKYRQLVDHTVVVVIAMILLAGYVGFLDLVMRGFLALILPGQPT